jgi:tetratricopeptide (TPR) repeat protein
MNMRLVVLTASMVASPLFAQTAAEHIVMGDRDHAAMNAESALRHYQAAIAADPNNAEALWRASREAIDLGEFDEKGRDSLYSLGEQFARRAVQANPQSSMTHFALAKAIGRKALSMGARDRVKFAGEVRKEALESLRLDSTNAGALHVMGMWNANVMRLSGMSRFLAKNLLGGKVFEEANWKDAVAYLERASTLEPERVVHKLALAAVYADSGNKPKARETYQAVMQLKAVDYNDKHYQRQADEALKALR